MWRRNATAAYTGALPRLQYQASDIGVLETQAFFSVTGSGASGSKGSSWRALEKKMSPRRLRKMDALRARRYLPSRDWVRKAIDRSSLIAGTPEWFRVGL